MKNYIGVVIASFILISCKSTIDLRTKDSTITKEDIVKYTPVPHPREDGTKDGLTVTTTCGETHKQCVLINEVEIFKTPNDGGTHEEWEIFYTATLPYPFHQITTDSYHLPRMRPPDNLNPWWPATASSTFDYSDVYNFPNYSESFSTGRVCSVLPEYSVFIKGFEWDGYFNPPDRIPKLLLIVENPCLTRFSNSKRVDTCSSTNRNIQSSTICTTNRNGSRAACYSINACWE